VRALERTPPGVPPAPGTSARREFAASRHGPSTFSLNRDGATGRGLAPPYGPTRTAADFVAQRKATVATEPRATRWPFVVDNPNRHQSAAALRSAAAVSGRAADRGLTGQSGLLASQARRAACVRDPAHTLVFPSTPQHASWRNQIAAWRGILPRTLLRRGAFRSTDALVARLLAFIASDNQTPAKPCTWTYQGQPLCDSPPDYSRRAVLACGLTGAEADALGPSALSPCWDAPRIAEGNGQVNGSPQASNRSATLSG